MVKLGVFDSGIGGKSVADRLNELFPEAEIIFVNDSPNVPYGTRPKHEIISLTDAAIKPLLDKNCNAIIIACNTATTNAIDYLRLTYPDTHFVGMEPMIKPAASLTKTGTIAVLATPGTLASDKYAHLKQTWARNIKVIEPDCSDWASLIENGQSDTIDLDSTISQLLDKHVDVIVLGCTHYHWLKQDIQNLVGDKVSVLEPSDAIGARIESLISTNSQLPE